MGNRARREEYTCDICGIRVKRWPNQLKNGRATCGTMCPGVKTVRPCNNCTMPTSLGRFCSEPCKDEYNEPALMYRRCSAKRQSVYNKGETVDRLAVFDAHDWICHLCNFPINPDLRMPHEFAATLDHVVPISRGGQHVWTNLRPAHSICNQNKSDALIEELMVQ